MFGKNLVKQASRYPREHAGHALEINNRPALIIAEEEVSKVELCFLTQGLFLALCRGGDWRFVQWW